MLSSTKTWYSGLTKVSKVGLWAVTAVLGGSFFAAAASQPPTTPQPETQQVQQAEKTKSNTETKTTTETEAIPFDKTTVQDGNLEKGATKIQTAGANGVKTITYKVTYTDGKETSKKKVSEETTTSPVSEVTAIGTYVAPPTPPPSNCDPNYTPCVPNVSYDLDCPDIGFRVTVIGYDKHRFDRDNDGQGCESY